MFASWMRRTVVRRLIIASSLCALSYGCGERQSASTPTPGDEPIAAAAPARLGSGERWRPVHRLASAPGAASLPPTATIASETRPVLREVPAFALNYTPAYAVPSDGRVALEPPLPEELQLEEVFVAIHVRPDDRWISLPGRLLRSRVGRGKLRVDVDFDLPDAAGRNAGVWVQALAPVDSGAAPLESPSVRIPERARLVFATGILEPAWGQGPVEFTVSACRPAGCEVIFRERLDPETPEGRGWRDHALGLQSLAGEEVALRFEARALGTGDGAEPVSLPLWGDPGIFAPGPRVEEEWNLVLLSLDTLRSDHMSVYGYARETTPFIERLASRGTLFERYVAAASSTRPSHMTMFTSLQPSVHGATENAGVRSLPLSVTTLAERLREAGFETGAITEDGAIDRSRGFGRGFGVYVENRSAQSANMRIGHIEQTFAQGLAWLDRNENERFFLFLHTYQVHNPFTPPPAYDRFFTERIAALEPPAALRDDWDPLLYDREIRYVDDQVGELIGALEERELLGRTLFVLTSDHGEAFLEHGFVAHGADVHEEVLAVPLVVVGPGVPADRRIATPIGMVDLMPTLLDLLGVPQTGQEMGRSHAKLVRGAAEDETELRPIYSEAWASQAHRARGSETIEQPTFSVRLGDHKLIRSRRGKRFRYELYDLAADPGEKTNLFVRDRETASELEGLLERYEAAVTALHEELGAERPREPAIDPDLEEKLRALGYLE